MLYKNLLFKSLYYLLLFICMVSTVVAETKPVNVYSQLSDEQFEIIINIKNLFSEIDQYQNKGMLSIEQATGAKAYILLQQQSVMDTPLDHTKLKELATSCMQDEKCRKKTIMDRFSGIFSFIHIMWFIASILILVGLIAVLANYKKPILRTLRPVKLLLRKIFSLLASVFSVLLPILARFFRSIPELLYELLALSISIMVVYLAQFTSEPSQPYVAFMGNILAMIVLSIIFRRHRDALKGFYKKYYLVLRHRPNALLMLISCSVWAGSAILYNSQLLGFFSIAWLLSWLGFGFILTPLQYSVGFENRNSIVRGTFGAFLLLVFYISMSLSGIHIPYYANFETGIQYLGTFVFFIGLLISSSKWVCQYYKFNYIITQLVTIISGLSALYIGSLYEMPVLRGIGGTFFAIYLLEKQFEFPWNKKRAAWLLLLLGITLYAIANIVSVYPEYFFMSAAVI